MNNPCNCSYCSQFYFLRVKYNNYIKKNINNNDILNNKINNNDIVMNDVVNKKNKIENNKLNDEKIFSVRDLELVRDLNEQNMNSNEISEKTNIPYSIVNYLVQVINYK